MKKYCFGIDVGGTTVKCGLFTVDGEVLDKWEIETRTEDNGVNILPDVAATIKAKIDEKQLNAEEIAGVGIGVPGPVNDQGEVPVAVNLHWGFTPIEKELSEMTGLTGKAGNGCQCSRTWRNVAGSRQRTQKYRYGNAWNRCRWWNYH